MIEVKNLYHDYSGEGNYAVSDISFTINKGQIFGFLGPSGAGKSTVQNIMTGLLELQKGAVTYDGVSIKELDSDFFNQIGVSFEHPNVYTKLTAYENLKYFAGLFTVPTQDPMAVLESVGLLDHADKKAGDFSKGMRQRLNLARALMNNPKFLFLDEPTSGLDPSTSARIRELIDNERKKGAIIFLTTHNMELADKLCDQVAFLHDGRISAMDSPENLKLKYGKKEVEVTYQAGEMVLTKRFSMDESEDLSHFLKEVTPLKIHSLEATLEDIFLQVTGKELS